MKIWSTKNQNMVFQVLSGFANSYLVGKGSSYVLVDTGRRSQWPNLLGSLEVLGIAENSLSGLILTHTHYDHVENAARIKSRYHVPLYVHSSEAQFLARGDSPIPQGSLVITKWIVDRLDSIPLRFPVEPVSADIVVEEEMDLSFLGLDARILHTPGHSSGSLSLVIDSEIAIVGDTMWGLFKESLFPPFADNPRNLVHSWQKLLDTGCSLFLPGHGQERSLSLVKAQLKKFKQIYHLE